MGEAAVALAPAAVEIGAEVAPAAITAAEVGGEAAGIGLAAGGAEAAESAGGLFGTGVSVSDAASGLSIGSLALSGAGSILGGNATAAQKQTEATNYLYAGAAKALNYRLEGETKAVNYEYAGTTAQTQREMEASGYTVQGSRAQRAADFGKLQASLTDVTMRENLARTLGGIETTLSARHVDPSSPTSSAFMGRQQILGDRQRQASLLSINAQVAEDEASSRYYDAAAKFALGQGTRAKEFADYNASVSRFMGETNAQIAEKSASLSATAAGQVGDAAVAAGDISGIAKILAGLGKAAA